MNVTEEKVGDHYIITVENDCGMSVELSSLGAGIRKVTLPDKTGKRVAVTACPVDEEENRNDYYGKIIGRTSGRITGAEFTIGKKTAHLEKNNAATDNLHGGSTGFHQAVFGYKTECGEDWCDVIFTHFSPDGEGGYFGDVNVTVTYRVMKNVNSFKILYGGEVSEPTILNLTNHVYWNMSGDLSESVKENVLYVNAPEYGVVTERLTTEKIVPVTKEFDFRTPRKIGEFVEEECVKKHTGGYDHPYFLGKGGDVACSLYSEKSGIKLLVKTSYPCVVVYTDNMANPERFVLEGVKDCNRLAVCLECQYHPDGIHVCPQNCGICAPQSPYSEFTEYIFEQV